MCVVAGQNVEKLPALVSDTLKSDKIYIAEGNITVPAGLQLVLEPGVIIKFDELTRLNVEGSLEALGKEDRPVVLTSLKNDERGGDNNGDGYESGPAPMDWEGVEIKNMNRAQVLKNTVIEYANIGLRAEKNRALELVNEVFNNNGTGKFYYNDKKMDVKEGIGFSFKEIIENVAAGPAKKDTVVIKNSNRMYWILGSVGIGAAAAGLVYWKTDKGGEGAEEPEIRPLIEDPPGPPTD